MSNFKIITSSIKQQLPIAYNEQTLLRKKKRFNGLRLLTLCAKINEEFKEPIFSSVNI